MLVASTGGHVSCPSCGVVLNVLPMVTPSVAQKLPDNRRAVVWGSFLTAGIISLLLGWWGILLGLALLGWAIAGAYGKISRPFSSYVKGTIKTDIVGIALGGLVVTCGAFGEMARQKKLEKEAFEAQEKIAQEEAQKTAQEQTESALREKAEGAAVEYSAGLDAVEKLLAENQLEDAATKMETITTAVSGYRELNPIPEPIVAHIARHELLKISLQDKQHTQLIQDWIANAEGIVKDQCENKDAVETAKGIADSLEGKVSDETQKAKVVLLTVQLDKCLTNMPPPSHWEYDVRSDPMGGSTAHGIVQSTNTLNFDFPYHGEQLATLRIRSGKRLEVLVSVVRGQFLCTMGCSVTVRFDDSPPQRWRATGPSDYSTEVIFLRKEAAFVKALKKAKVVRIAVDFYQEGTHVLEFPVARFDDSMF